jgi:copper chaperone CopZ
MKGSLSIIAVLLAAPAATAEDVKVQYRLTGLFQPDRVDDLRRQAGTFTVDAGGAPARVDLVDVDYETAVVTFAYDADSKAFKNSSPEQVRQRINGLLRNISRGSFGIRPLGTLGSDQLVRERLAVAGLDCKGCAYGAYRAIATIEGVERAVVSFKEGHVTAWIDPAKTDREALVAALKKARVDVIDGETAAGKPAAER